MWAHHLDSRHMSSFLYKKPNSPAVLPYLVWLSSVNSKHDLPQFPASYSLLITPCPLLRILDEYLPTHSLDFRFVSLPNCAWFISNCLIWSEFRLRWKSIASHDSLPQKSWKWYGCCAWFLLLIIWMCLWRNGGIRWWTSLLDCLWLWAPYSSLSNLRLACAATVADDLLPEALWLGRWVLFAL